MNRDRSYYRKQRMRAIHRKETILRQLGGEENVLAWEHGAAGRLSKGKIHCSCWMCRRSRMTILRSGISGRPWMPPSSCWKSSNFSHEKTLPSRDRQTSAAPGQEALTPYLTTVRDGTRGNSGFKSVKKYSIPSRKCWKALQITTKNLVQPFGSRMPQVRILSLGPFYAEKPPEMAVFLRFLFYFCLLGDCGSAAISGTEKRREHGPRIAAETAKSLTHP